MKPIKIIFVALLFLSVACGTKNEPVIVQIETIYGKMKVKLYDETPLHRDNFLKLVKGNFYDSLLFHRVINEFMIQGGDPDSKNALKGKMLGEGDVGYTIKAEFNPSLIHKKGVIAAARKGDQMNPEKESSGCQFYIVQGKIFSEEELEKMEQKINFPKRKKLVFEYIEKPENIAIKQKIDSFQRIGDFHSINNEYTKVAELLEEEYEKMDLFKYTPEQIEIYKTIGGTPHLDQGYTVFGEVIEGLNVIDSIAKVRTDVNDRPNDDIIMKIKIVKK